MHLPLEVGGSIIVDVPTAPRDPNGVVLLTLSKGPSRVEYYLMLHEVRTLRNMLTTAIDR
jgi:hypothetical protein